MRCFPCLQAVQDTFSLAERGKEGSSWLLSSAPWLRLAALAVGLARLPGELCYNHYSNNNPG